MTVFSRDGSRLASIAGDVVRVLDMHSLHTPPLEFANRGHDPISMDISADGAHLAVGWSDGRTLLWDVRSPSAAPLVLVSDQSSAVRSVAFSPDASRLAIGQDGVDKVILWDWRNPAGIPNRHVLLGSHSNSAALFFSSLAFSPDGTRLAAGALSVPAQGENMRWGSNIRVWDLNNPNGIPALVHQDDFVDGGVMVAFSPRGDRLA